MLVLAQAAGSGGGGDSGGGGFMGFFGVYWILIAFGLIFYFLIWRPERQKEKKRQAMLKALEKNDKVVTLGGLHGVVKSVSEEDVMLLVDDKRDVTVKISRSAVHAVLNRTEEGEIPTQEKK